MYKVFCAFGLTTIEYLCVLQRRLSRQVTVMKETDVRPLRQNIIIQNV